MDRTEDMLKDDPEIEHYARVAGYGLISGQGTSYGTIIIRLKDWSERRARSIARMLWCPASTDNSEGDKGSAGIQLQPAARFRGYSMGNSLELNLPGHDGWNWLRSMKRLSTIPRCFERASVGNR